MDLLEIQENAKAKVSFNGKRDTVTSRQSYTDAEENKRKKTSCLQTQSVFCSYDHCSNFLSKGSDFLLADTAHSAPHRLVP
jgi:hypothetical protein